MDNNGAIIFPNNYQIDGAMCLERAIMADTADGAMDELIKLLKLDEPLWIKSSSDGRFTLHRENYENIFPLRANIIKACNNSARFEASKHSGIVTMGAVHLVEMFLDSVSTIKYAIGELSIIYWIFTANECFWTSNKKLKLNQN